RSTVAYRPVNHRRLPSFPPRRSSDLSQHLMALKEIGLIQGEIEGPAICYCIDAKTVAAFRMAEGGDGLRVNAVADGGSFDLALEDRKSTRLNSSHVKISYAVFCLNKN